MSGGLDLDQPPGNFGNHGVREGPGLFRDHPGQTDAFDETASPPPSDDGEAVLSGRRATNHLRKYKFGCLCEICVFDLRESRIMAEINKLSVEKVLDKLRASDVKHSKDALFHNKIDALDEEIERMRLQRQRLEQHQRKRDKGNC
jgi:hypothetical protein